MAMGDIAIDVIVRDRKKIGGTIRSISREAQVWNLETNKEIRLQKFNANTECIWKLRIQKLKNTTV